MKPGSPANVSQSVHTTAQSTTHQHLRSNVAGVYIDDLTEQEAITRIKDLASGGRGHYLVVVNAAKAVAAEQDHRLREIISRADIVTADGMSVVWASRLLGRPLRERVTGIDLFEKRMACAAESGQSVFLLGARQDVVVAAAEVFKRRHSLLKIVGLHDGYFEEGASSSVADQIRASGADLLFVAMGSPRQELWIAEHIDRSGVKFAIGVGGAFDHLAGYAQRAPRWMQQSGLEWLHRLSREPRRLWRRYLLGNSRFLYIILRQAFIEKRR